MTQLSVRWRHPPFSDDAGQVPPTESLENHSDAVRTGVISNEHQAVVDDRPVLVEDATGRVYRAADLPPGTRVIITDPMSVAAPLVEDARRAGFEVVPAA